MKRLRADLMEALGNYDKRVSDHIANNLDAITTALKNREPLPKILDSQLAQANELSKAVGETIKLIDKYLPKDGK